MDNFPSFTELGQLPDWYEAVNSRRARQLGMQDEMEQKPRKTAGSLGVSGLSYAAPGSRAAGGMERIRRKLGKTKGSLGSLRSGRARCVCDLSTGYSQNFLCKGSLGV